MYTQQREAHLIRIYGPIEALQSMILCLRANKRIKVNSGINEFENRHRRGYFPGVVATEEEKWLLFCLVVVS